MGKNPCPDQGAFPGEGDHDDNEEKAEDRQTPDIGRKAANVAKRQGQTEDGGRRQQDTCQPAVFFSRKEAAEFKSRRAHGDLGKGPEIGLVGKKEPLFNVPQRSGIKNKNAQDHSAEDRPDNMRVCPVEQPAERVGYGEGDQHGAQVPGAADDRTAQTQPLQEKEGGDPPQEIDRVQLAAGQKADQRGHQTGRQVIGEEGIDLMRKKAERPAGEAAQIVRNGILPERKSLPHVPGRFMAGCRHTASVPGSVFPDGFRHQKPGHEEKEFNTQITVVKKSDRNAACDGGDFALIPQIQVDMKQNDDGCKKKAQEFDRAVFS